MKIKYRVWDKENNKFYEPTYEAYLGRLEDLSIGPCGDLCMRTINESIHESCFPDRFIVGQFTGRQDICKTDVYEDDILGDTHGFLAGVVKWENDTSRFVLMRDIGKGKLEYDGDLEEFSEVEVIGNIYENGELLVGGK